MAKKISSPALGALSNKWNAIFVTIFVIASLIVILPVALVFIISLSSTESLESIGYSYFPTGLSFVGYKYIWFSKDSLFQAYWVTIYTSVVGTVLTLAVTSMYSYVTSLQSFPYRKFLTWLSFFTALFGGGLIPEYILNTKYYHLENTLTILIVPGLLASAHVIILRTFIRTTVPGALIDSAKIDGAGHFRIFGTIVLPLLKPGVATIGLFTFVHRWNSWFQAMMYNQDEDKLPIQTVLTRIQQNVDFLRDSMDVSGPDALEAMRNLPTDNMRMACTVIVLIPIMCAYPFFQRYFVKGLTMGSVKE